MEDYNFVKNNDAEKKKAIYSLVNLRLRGFVVDHGVEGLYWFNTQEGIYTGKRDFLVSAEDLKVLL